MSSKFHLPNPSDILHKIMHAVEDALHKLSGALQSALAKLKGAEHDALGAVMAAEHKAVSAVQATAKKAEADLEGSVGDAFKLVAGKVMTAAMAVLDASIPDSFQIQIGPIGFVWDGNVPHSEDFHTWATNPPSSRAEILAMVTHLAPTQVFAAADAELAELFITSSDEGIAVQATWTKDRFIADAEKIIAAF